MSSHIHVSASVIASMSLLFLEHSRGLEHTGFGFLGTRETWAQSCDHRGDRTFVPAPGRGYKSAHLAIFSKNSKIFPCLCPRSIYSQHLRDIKLSLLSAPLCVSKINQPFSHIHMHGHTCMHMHTQGPMHRHTQDKCTQSHV